MATAFAADDEAWPALELLEREGPLELQRARESGETKSHNHSAGNDEQ